MAWEVRKGRNRYFTRSVRRGNRIQRLYYGAGVIGKVAEAAGAEIRLARQEGRDRFRRSRDSLQLLDQQYADAQRWSVALCRLALANLGYFQHSRGEYRRKRRYDHAK